MDRPLTAWAKVLGKLGLLLLALGVGPALVVRYLFPEIDPLIAVLMLFGVAPLGVLSLAVSSILFLAALLRR